MSKTNKPDDVRMSRELLEKISAMQWSGPERIECRVAIKSLLDAKPCQHEFIYYGTSELPRRCRHCDAEELRAILAQPADQQGEPDFYEVSGNGVRPGLFYTRPDWAMEDPRYTVTPFWRSAAQPATAKVTLRERLDIPHRDEFESADQHAAAVGEANAYNACLDEVAKLNTPQ